MARSANGICGPEDLRAARKGIGLNFEYGSDDFDEGRVPDLVEWLRIKGEDRTAARQRGLDTEQPGSKTKTEWGIYESTVSLRDMFRGASCC